MRRLLTLIDDVCQAICVLAAVVAVTAGFAGLLGLLIHLTGVA